MDLQILLLLGQDGITNGAIYALLALALVLVFAVTRVIFIPQGEFVAFGALTLASLQAGKVPGTVWLLLGLGTAVALLDGYRLLRDGRYAKLPTLLITNVGVPLLCRRRPCSPCRPARCRCGHRSSSPCCSSCRSGR
jgi:branched-subunit amino acid ABC-type transport system permease component